MTIYTEQADEFLRNTNTDYSCELLRTGKHFIGDTEDRNIYKITLVRSGRKYIFEFGQSINATRAGEAPSEYDVLSCLTKHHPGTFEDFCAEYGYDPDSRRAEKTYQGVLAEYEALERLYSEIELDMLREIN